MSTGANKSTPREVPTVSGIVSLEETTKVTQGFVSAVKNLSNTPGFQAVAELVDSIPKLKKDLQEGEKSLQKANDDLKRAQKERLDEVQRNLQSYSHAYKIFEDERATLKQDIDKLNMTIRENEGKNSALQKEVDNLKTAGRKIKDLLQGKTSKLEETERELEGVKKENGDSKAKVVDLTTKYEATQNQVSALELSFGQSKQENDQVRADLESSRRGLEELQSFSASLTDTNEDDVAAELNKIWSSATLLVRDVLSQDLPDSQLERPWKALNKAAKDILDTSLPKSNSAIAKELRIVVVLGNLADLIDSYIFQPTYLLPETTRFKDLLYMLASEEPKKERFLRGMMLSILAAKQGPAKETMVNGVVKELMTSVGVEDAIPPDLVAKFKQGLKQVVVNAQDTWHTVQYSQHIFKCEFGHGPALDLKWDAFKFEVGDTAVRADTPVSVSDDDLDDDLIVIFPRVYFITEDDEPEAIAAGTAVKRSQIIALIREEQRKIRSTQQTLPHSGKKQSRAMSMAIDGSRSRRKSGPFLP